MVWCNYAGKQMNSAPRAPDSRNNGREGRCVFAKVQINMLAECSDMNKHELTVYEELKFSFA